MNQARGSAWEQKALALAIWLKYILRNSRLEHYSLGRLSALSGVSYRALKTYMAILHSDNYIHFEGTEKNKVLVVGKIASKTSNRNIDISAFNFNSYKDVYNSLRTFLMARIQAKKDYIAHLLQVRHNPGRDVNYKVVLKKVKNLVQCGVLKSSDQKYREWGLSLQKIAKEVGCCVKTAQKIVKYGISQKWIAKKHNFEQIYAPKIGYFRVEGYTFSTRNNIYRVHPNTYTLSPSLSSALVLPV